MLHLVGRTLVMGLSAEAHQVVLLVTVMVLLEDTVQQLDMAEQDLAMDMGNLVDKNRFQSVVDHQEAVTVQPEDTVLQWEGDEDQVTVTEQEDLREGKGKVVEMERAAHQPDQDWVDYPADSDLAVERPAKATERVAQDTGKSTGEQEDLEEVWAD